MRLVSQPLFQLLTKILELGRIILKKVTMFHKLTLIGYIPIPNQTVYIPQEKIQEDTVL